MTSHEQYLRDGVLRQDGSEFEIHVLSELEAALSALDSDTRTRFRNGNAGLIASSQLPRMLIVAGPGTGKSHIFKARIAAWLSRHPLSKVHVASFVRKLVRDLEAEIAGSSDIPDEAKARVRVTTLHGLARSLVERAGGPPLLPFRAHISVISNAWDDMVWGDVIGLEPRGKLLAIEELTDQFHNLQMASGQTWSATRDMYFRICQYYNAMGFADSIVHAIQCVEADSTLLEADLWIIDEFQDFNTSEDALVRACTNGARAVLLAGDDDQALYQTLKSSHPDIIRSYYADAAFANAMLPYCGRNTYHICAAASSFIAAVRDELSIDKVYLPLVMDEAAEPVRVLACSEPKAAVSYIERFIEAHRAEIEERKRELDAGSPGDPYLLILSPSNDCSLYASKKAQDERLMNLVAEWTSETAGPGADYLKIRIYARAGRYPEDNFALRKVLDYERLPQGKVLGWLAEGLATGAPLTSLSDTDLAGPIGRCRQVAAVFGLELSPEEAAAELSQVVPVKDLAGLVRDLTQAAEVPADGDEEAPTAGTASAVEMMTPVRSKGLSADHVMILGFDDTNMSYVGELGFYVGMTRARHSLHLVMATGANGATKLSPFLDALPEEHCVHAKCLVTGEQAPVSRRELMDGLAAREFAKTSFKRKPPSPWSP